MDFMSIIMVISMLLLTVLLTAVKYGLPLYILYRLIRWIWPKIKPVLADLHTVAEDIRKKKDTKDE